MVRSFPLYGPGEIAFSPGRFVVWTYSRLMTPAHIDAGDDPRRCGSIPTVGVVSDGNTGEKPGFCGKTGENTKSYPNLRPAWRPGETGNPGGRSMSLVNLAWEVRRRTGGGTELIDLHLAIARGETIPVASRGKSRGKGQRRVRGQIPTLDQRLEAARWLADRG